MTRVCLLLGMVDSICIFAFGKNYSIDQCLHWSKRYATGISHLDGFESHHPQSKKKKHTKRCAFLFGGGWWIRTTEGIASRFTVCPLWPLGKSPIFFFRSLEPVDGLEPPTY